MAFESPNILKKIDKRERDRNTGQFVFKGDEPRKVRSMRLTDTAWKRLGDKVEGTKMTRADLIEHIARDTIDIMMDSYSKYEPEPTVTITKKELEALINQALDKLNVGKQAPTYKRANKGFQKLLSLMFPDSSK